MRVVWWYTKQQLHAFFTARVSGCVYAGTRVAVKVIDQDMRTLAASGVQMEALLGKTGVHERINISNPHCKCFFP